MQKFAVVVHICESLHVIELQLQIYATLARRNVSQEPSSPVASL